MNKPKYYDYINSPAWQEKKAQYRASKLPQTCLVCGSRKVDIHHKTYKRLGAEYLRDLVPLCRTHHDECHAFMKRQGMNYWGGTNRYLISKGKNQLGREKKGKR